MSGAVIFFMNKASAAVILSHLLACDTDFVESLIARVDLREYANKIANYSMRFEAWSGESLVGMVAIYCNDLETRAAHITSVSVINKIQGKGIATQLLSQSVEHAKKIRMQRICLEVDSGNRAAIALYEKCGFVVGSTGNPMIVMDLFLDVEKSIEQRSQLQY